jgi:hypothetical protein
MINWWSFFDGITNWGHVFYATVVVLTGLFIQINAFSALNVALICLFYLLVVLTLRRRQHLLKKETGIQTAIDIRMASLITKRYKREVSYEFLNLREVFW